MERLFRGLDCFPDELKGKRELSMFKLGLVMTSWLVIKV